MGKVKFQFANFKQAAAYSKWFVSQTFSSIACTTNWFGQISHLQSKLVLLCYYYHAQSNSIAKHDCSEEVILTLPTKQNRKWQRSRRLPPRHPSKAMDENIPDLPALVDEIKAGLEAVEQVLLLGVPQRHGHARDPQPGPGALHHPHQRPRGHRGGRWCALLAGDTHLTIQS